MQVGGLPVTIPYIANSAYTVQYALNYLVYNASSLGLTVEFDGSGVFVLLDDRWTNRVSGICGNADGKARNDYVTKNGADAFNETNPGRVIGDSWVYNDIFVQM